MKERYYYRYGRDYIGNVGRPDPTASEALQRVGISKRRGRKPIAGGTNSRPLESRDHTIFGNGIKPTDYAGIAPGAGVIFDTTTGQYVPIEEYNAREGKGGR